MNIKKINNILELYKIYEEKNNYIDENFVDKLINIIKSGRVPKEENILDILEKLDEGGLL
jgi:hypothetical protein